MLRAQAPQTQPEKNPETIPDAGLPNITFDSFSQYLTSIKEVNMTKYTYVRHLMIVMPYSALSTVHATSHWVWERSAEETRRRKERKTSWYVHNRSGYMILMELQQTWKSVKQYRPWMKSPKYFCPNDLTCTTLRHLKRFWTPLTPRSVNCTRRYVALDMTRSYPDWQSKCSSCRTKTMSKVHSSSTWHDAPQKSSPPSRMCDDCTLKSARSLKLLADSTRDCKRGLGTGPCKPWDCCKWKLDERSCASWLRR